MDIAPFNFSSPSRCIFGAGRISMLPQIASTFGHQLLLVTGKSSLRDGQKLAPLLTGFSTHNIKVDQITIPGEPTPEDIDTAVQRYQHKGVTLVVAVGGGSTLDAGKAIAAMMGHTCSVTDFLEGVGTKAHPGDTLPFIAVPTTAGTGSEATKNAVISKSGVNGFKKSLRHDNFIPDVALVDPLLTITCPERVTTACGMDALTQLLEAYVSTQATPITDALCAEGLKNFGQALEIVIGKDPENMAARSRLSYGSYLSGLGLANAGLGTVHGFAGVIGGMCTMSHGNICGTLLAETTRHTINALNAQAPDHPALTKYAQAARLLALAAPSSNLSLACSSLIDGLERWTEKFMMPRLSTAGLITDDINDISQADCRKNNPVHLPQHALQTILRARL